jgi:hypothetical protein
MASWPDDNLVIRTGVRRSRVPALSAADLGKRRGLLREGNRHDPQQELQGPGPPAPARNRNAARRRVRAHDARKQRSQPVQGLLADAAGAVTAMNPADAAGLLPAAWQAVSVVGAAAELLAQCAGTRDYRGPFRLAGQPLSDAVKAMRAVPALRSAPAEVNPAGSPASRLTGSDAEEIRAGILATCDALAGALGHVPPGIRPPSAARACRAAARSARLISGIYQAPAVPPADDDGTAAARPCYLDAGTLAEMGTAISAHLCELLTADPADTTAALAAAWYGFSLAPHPRPVPGQPLPRPGGPAREPMPAWCHPRLLDRRPLENGAVAATTVVVAEDRNDVVSDRNSWLRPVSPDP